MLGRDIFYELSKYILIWQETGFEKSKSLKMMEGEITMQKMTTLCTIVLILIFSIVIDGKWVTVFYTPISSTLTASEMRLVNGGGCGAQCVSQGDQCGASTNCVGNYGSPCIACPSENGEDCWNPGTTCSESSVPCPDGIQGYCQIILGIPQCGGNPYNCGNRVDC